MGNERGSLLQRWQLLVEALCDDALSKGDCTVLAVIAGHAGKDGQAWPGVNRIASLAGIHRSTVIRSVDNLVAREWLEVSRKRGCSNRYRLASSGRVGATSTSRVDATSPADGPVAPTHTTSRVDATGVVAPTLPDQSRGRYPNSAFELDSPNSKKATQPAALSFDDWVEQKPKPSPEEIKAAAVAKKAEQRESIRTEYLESLSSHPKHAKGMERSFPDVLADLIQRPELRKLVP